MVTQDLQIELAHGAPTDEQREALRELAAAAQVADGAPPFGDQTWVELKRSDPAAPLTVAYAWLPSSAGHPGRLAGAGVVVLGSSEELGSAEELVSGEDLGDDAGTPGENDLTPDVLELAVDPQHRRAGVATTIATALSQEQQTDRPHRAWAHGGHPGGPRLAEKFGWRPVRELWQMRLENDVELPPVELPEGITLRSFRPGEDDESWVQANAAAFADHPEQGRMTVEDLHARMAEDWFSAEGFLLAEDAGELLGFHWTKIHTEDVTTDGQRPTGEVYVVGVTPKAQGRRLGLALTLAGIEHLRAQQLEAVILYVDAENTAAARLYTKLGFTVEKTDSQYAPGIFQV